MAYKEGVHGPTWMGCTYCSRCVSLSLRLRCSLASSISPCVCLFVLYIPWIPGEHRREICAVDRVTAHFRGFEEDSRSEVVFWIDEWSIEFGFTVSLSRNMCSYHAAYSSYILPLTLACYHLGQSRDSDVVAEDHHMFYKCYFAAVWNSLDVPAPDDCISAINPKMALRPMILPARFQPAWRHSQGVAELASRAHMGIQSIAVKMFIIHIFNSVQPFSVVVTASVIHGILA